MQGFPPITAGFLVILVRVSIATPCLIVREAAAVLHHLRRCQSKVENSGRDPASFERLSIKALAPTYGKTYAYGMNSMSASEAREKLYRLLDETARDHEPVLITGPCSNAVLVGEEDWNSIQETLHLLSVPGMRESIIEGIATPADQCEKEPGW
jgi:prevent-host-death family protein